MQNRRFSIGKLNEGTGLLVMTGDKRHNVKTRRFPLDTGKHFYCECGLTLE